MVVVGSVDEVEVVVEEEERTTHEGVERKDVAEVV